MQIEVISRTKLTASEGMVLTNGTVYGTVIFLAEGVENNYYEITEAEYQQKIAEAENGGI